jgi:hypothetical protein
MSDFISVLSSGSVWGVLSRFVFNIFFLFLLIGVIYFRFSKKERFLFTYLMTGITVFFVSSIMNSLTISVGAAFGLFAIFQVLRFRTRNFSVKDMAYIFTTIGISVINAVILQKYTILGVVIMNAIIILSAFFLELYLGKNNFDKYRITYDNLEMLRPENQQKLVVELSQKTGRNIIQVKIIEMDFKKEIAHLEIYYKVQ